MGISGGTGVGGSAQPPQIRESETTAFTETMKKKRARDAAGGYRGGRALFAAHLR